MATTGLQTLRGEDWKMDGHRVMADFGQTDFGQNRLWPNRLWPKPTLAKPTGQIEFDLLCGVLCCVVCCLSGVGTVSFHVWVLVSRFGLDRPSPGPPFPWTALPLDRPSPGPPFPWTAQNFALFFPSPAAKFVLFFPLWGVFSWNFGGV